MLRRAGVEILVSALTASESDELGLSEEQSCCTREGILFVSYPIEDRSVPSSFSEFSKLIESLDNKLRLGKAVAVHCRAGVGRPSISLPVSLVAMALRRSLRFVRLKMPEDVQCQTRQNSANGSNAS
jgi:hypothetical protein